MDEEQSEFEWARQEMERLLERSLSCVLGTSGQHGEPLASYAPFLRDGGTGELFVYVSALAKHYAHLRKGRRASVMIIEDERAAENLFARKRLTLDCSVEMVGRDTVEFEERMGRMEARLGPTLGYLKGMTDFDLFRLVPEEGRLVLGFGKAYAVHGPELGSVGYVRSGGGHRSKS